MDRNSNTYKILRDFTFGGIAGVIAKTICAPIQRVKLLLQTQHNNPKLFVKPYNDVSLNKESSLYGEVICQTYLDISLLKLQIFPLKMLSIERLLEELTKKNIQLISFQHHYFQEGLQDQQVQYLFILWILQEQGLGWILENYIRKDNLPDYGTVQRKQQYLMGYKVYIKVFQYLQQVYLFTGHFTLGILKMISGYDAGKYFIWGSEQQQKKANLFKKFLFAQFITTSSETLAYPLDTIRRRLMMQSGETEVFFKGTIDCFSKVYRDEGIKGFFKGNLSNIWRSIGSSLVLVLYDQFQNLFSKKY